MDNFDTMQFLINAGYSEETAKELIRISNEYGVPLITKYSYNSISELENAIKDKNVLGY